MFQRLLRRLSVGKKLLLIYLLDLSAVIFISTVLVNEKFIAIDFSRKELAGNAFISKVREPLLDAAVGGVAVELAPPPGQLVRDAELQHGEGMKSADNSAAFAARLEALRSTTEALAASKAAGLTPDGAREQLEEETRAVIAAGRELVTRIGNQSNLILDPDLDSYYTMSLVLLRYPELLDVAWLATSHLRDTAVKGGPLDNDARTLYLMLEGRLDASAQAIKSDFSEAVASAADNKLADALKEDNQKLQRSIERFRAATRTMLNAPEAERAIPAVEEAQLELLVDLRTSWRLSAAELDRLIDVRVSGFFHRMWLHLGTALFLLMVILTAVFYVARQIAGPLGRLSEVADRVRRTGDHTLRAHWQSGDEIGRLVLAFNDMLAQLDRERKTQQELAATARAAEAQQDLVEAIPIPMVVTAVPGHEVLHANGPAKRWLGSRHSDPWASGFESGVRSRFFQQLADREAVDEFEVRWRSPAGPAWAMLSARRLVYQGQDAVLTAFAPINHLKSMEQRLELWAKVFEASSEGIMIVDADHLILTVNKALCRHTAYDFLEMVGQSPDFVVGNNEGHAMLGELWASVDKRGSWQGEVRIRRRNESVYPAWLVVSAVYDPQGGVSHYICTSLDISERKASEARIQYLAHHDVLTGLPNRSLCIERLRLSMHQSDRTGVPVSVLFIDLDRFKTINDSLGHDVGDELLRSVAQRLLLAVRAGDTVSRLGGDEFIVVLNGAEDSDEVLSIVERRLIPLIREPHFINGAKLHVSCSVGIATYPDDARDIDELMRHADVAMYQAKALGRDSAQFFTPELNERAHKRLRLESHLRTAVERGEMSLHYQPRISARTGEVLAVEALLRWQSAELGSVSPGEFIPIAEESRLIVSIGAWVVGEACRQQAEWKSQGRGTLPISINVSGVQMRDETLMSALRDSIERHHVSPGTIELELTESTLMDGVESTLAQLHTLKAMGLKLSVDDFGTGYSSLTYLNRFPIDRLKIDRSFIRDLNGDAANLAITRAIIALGRTLGLQVVAEGVETEEVAETLRNARCDELQGYLFARPMPADQLIEWIGEDGTSGRPISTGHSRPAPAMTTF
ncbi:hypothetical protein BH09PSE5_BH09PSE5_02730 [soil metagenome]